jgi:hypothetical protein
MSSFVGAYIGMYASSNGQSSNNVAAFHPIEGETNWFLSI